MQVQPNTSSKLWTELLHFLLAIVRFRSLPLNFPLTKGFASLVGSSLSNIVGGYVIAYSTFWVTDLETERRLGELCPACEQAAKQ